MMMMIKRILFLFSFLAVAGGLTAQDNDFGIWLELNGKQNITNELDLQLTTEIRTFDNTSRVRMVFLEGGLEYSLTKNISVGGSYRLISRLEDDGVFYWRHRLLTDLNASMPKGNFTFSARLRLQRTTRTYIEDEEDLQASYVLRCRLKADYDIPGLPLKPYIYYEPFFPAFSGSAVSGINKYRISAGTHLRLTNRSRIMAGYIFQRDTEPRLRKLNVFSLAYSLRF